MLAFIFAHWYTYNNGGHEIVINDNSSLYQKNKQENINDEHFLSGINLNTADADELDSIMYVGLDDAEKIIEYRNEHGNFERVEDIENVKGLSTIIRKSVIDNTYV